MTGKGHESTFFDEMPPPFEAKEFTLGDILITHKYLKNAMLNVALVLKSSVRLVDTAKRPSWEYQHHTNKIKSKRLSLGSSDRNVPVCFHNLFETTK